MHFRRLLLQERAKLSIVLFQHVRVLFKGFLFSLVLINGLSYVRTVILKIQATKNCCNVMSKVKTLQIACIEKLQYGSLMIYERRNGS